MPLRDDAGGPDDSLAPGDIRPVDAMNGPDAATACATPNFYEPFTSTTPCEAFANAPYTDNAVVTQANGVLSITPNNASGVEPAGGCYTPTNTYLFGSGLTAIVNQTTTGTNAYTALVARNANAMIKVAGGMLRFQNVSTDSDIGAAVQYVPSVMRWWRIKPVGTTMIVAEYSENGTSWAPLGSAYTVVPPIMIGVEVTGGTTTIGNVGTAVFDQVMICP